jgi:hypothetical protein
MDPFWLWGDWLFSDTAVGEEGFEIWGGSVGTRGNVPSSINICLGLERLCEGIIVRLLGFLQPYQYKHIRLRDMLVKIQLINSVKRYFTMTITTFS